MTELIHTFKAVIEGLQGEALRVHALGTQRGDGTWEGRLLFEPIAGRGRALLSERETTQPNRADLEYWVSGLEPAYLEGALARARRAAERAPNDRAEAPVPASPGGLSAPLPHPIMDPFEVYAQGEEILREELSALHLSHLQNLARAYGFALPGDPVLQEEQSLRETILAGVRSRVER